MSVASADVHKAVTAVWNASTLDALFQALWASGVGEYTVLNDQEAAPNQPFPYCVYELTLSSTTDRMSGDGSTIREVRNIAWNFHVHARQVDGDARTAKEIAAYLAEEIMKVFGGHPTVAATDLSLDSGGFLISEYQSDFGIRTGDQTHRWDIQYIFKIDVPIAV